MVPTEDRDSNASVCRDNRELGDDCLPELTAESAEFRLRRFICPLAAAGVSVQVSRFGRSFSVAAVVITGHP